MKLSLKIMTALFIFAVIGITSCTKNEFGIDNSEEQFMEDVNLHNSKQITTKQLSRILKNKKGVKVIENYFHKESGVIGTLYEYNEPDGNVVRVLESNKNLENYDTKTWIGRAAVSAHWSDGIGDMPGYWYYRCDSVGRNCYGWTSLYIYGL